MITGDIETGFFRLATHEGPDTLRVTITKPDGSEMIFAVNKQEAGILSDIFSVYAQEEGDGL